VRDGNTLKAEFGKTVSGTQNLEGFVTRGAFLHLSRPRPSRVGAKGFHDSQAVLQGRVVDALAALHAVAQLPHVTQRRLQMQFNDESGLFLAGHCRTI
jgi:hypothetical protein